MIPTAEEFDRNCTYFLNKDKFIEFAKLHAVNILKEVCKTELEYQRNYHLINNIK